MSTSVRLAELGDPVIEQLVLASVVPAPSASRVPVTLVSSRDDVDLDAAQAGLRPRAQTPIAYADKATRRARGRGATWASAHLVVLSIAGCALRATFGRMLFAGTETAVHHVGYLEGAIESGHRVPTAHVEADREVLYGGQMRTLAFSLVLAFAASTTTGCFVRESRPGKTVVVKEKRGCGPAHHWDGNSCVHNGKAKGHNK